jgi:hypothetical protein
MICGMLWRRGVRDVFTCDVNAVARERVRWLTPANPAKFAIEIHVVCIAEGEQ